MGSNFEVYKVFRHVQLVSNFEVYSLYIYITIESRECSFWKYNQTLQETGLGAWKELHNDKEAIGTVFGEFRSQFFRPCWRGQHCRNPRHHMGSNFEVYKVFRHVQLVSNFEVYSLYIYITIESRECSFWKYNQTLQETGLGAWERTSQWQRGHWNRFWEFRSQFFRPCWRGQHCRNPRHHMGSNFEVYKVFRHVQLFSNFEVYSLYICIYILIYLYMSIVKKPFVFCKTGSRCWWISGLTVAPSTSRAHQGHCWGSLSSWVYMPVTVLYSVWSLVSFLRQKHAGKYIYIYIPWNWWSFQLYSQ